MLFFYAVFRVRLVLFRHLQDCHNIFFRQRLEEANVSVSAENAFLSHFLDLGIGWINAKFSEGGWHVYRVAPGLPGSDGCENSIRNIRIAGLGSINSENLLTKLCKSSRICLIHISSPASPDRCKWRSTRRRKPRIVIRRINRILHDPVPADDSVINDAEEFQCSSDRLVDHRFN